MKNKSASIIMRKSFIGIIISLLREDDLEAAQLMGYWGAEGNEEEYDKCFERSEKLETVIRLLGELYLEEKKEEMS
ncbi:hypothetical protein J7J13_01260 [bacterium]|nr:hypothetical protein [bacterium]